MFSKSTVIASKFGIVERFLVTFMYEIQGRTIIIGKWMSGRLTGTEDQLFLEDILQQA